MRLQISKRSGVTPTAADLSSGARFRLRGSRSRLRFRTNFTAKRLDRLHRRSAERATDEQLFVDNLCRSMLANFRFGDVISRTSNDCTRRRNRAGKRGDRGYDGRIGHGNQQHPRTHDARVFEHFASTRVAEIALNLE